ncbi:thiamine diphosphokinase [Acholeplasma laidlawii]|uniref:thiamine diphosphokinase n=1 Tax=Acholeplasma laidlawii TaxID=2148 RepID=UPI001E384597|nr:thiamine diphosphokinase [Acholeplasma laidlawii]
MIVHPVPNNLNQIIKKPAYVIAVDQGLFDAYKQGVFVDLAIGDFDSLSDISLLDKVLYKRLNPVKDITDTEAALQYALSLNPAHTYILGGIGGSRLEHSYANLLLLFDYDNVSIMTSESVVVKFNVGMHKTKFNGYINIFSQNQAVISLTGFKYELDTYKLKMFDRLGISNELKDTEGTIKVHSGSILVVYTKKEQ